MHNEQSEKDLPDEMEQCIRKLRELMSENDKLHVLEKCGSDYLKRFLYNTDFVVENAFKKMKMFYDVLGEHPEWFTVDAPSEKKTFIDQDIRILTNVQDYQGRPIYIVKIGNMNSRTMDLVSDVVAVDDFFIEFLLSTYAACQYGLCVIIDVSNMSWNLLKWLTPSNIKTALKRMQTMPIKGYNLHIVNSSRILTVAVNIVWPFLPQQIKEGVHFHSEDWDSLHKHVDKELLPPEFGGTSETDYTKLRDRLYESNTDIANSFKTNRQSYLCHIGKELSNR